MKSVAYPSAWSRNVWWAGRDPAHLFGVFTSVLNRIGTGWIFLMMFAICADVIGRKLFDAPIRGVAELVPVSIVAIVFLQLANTLHVGRITRADVFIDWLLRKRPFAAANYQLLFHTLGAMVFGVITWGTYPAFDKAWRTDDFLGIEGDFVAPVWPFKLFILIGAAATTVQFLILAARDVWVIVSGQPEHVEAEADSPRGWPAIIGLLTLLVVGYLVATSGLSEMNLAILSIAAMLIMIYAGMHIGVALIVLSFLGIWIMKDDIGLAVRVLALASSGAIANYVFAVVPLFVLMGLLVNAGNIGKDTFEVCQWLLGRIKGGLGVATVSANAVFAAITGVSIASAAVFTKVAVPPMIEHGYTPRFSVGVVAGSSVLGMLIPPSLLLIIYGLLAEDSVGTLFIAAIVPGIVLSAAFCLAIVAMANYWPSFVGNLRLPDTSRMPSAWSRKPEHKETLVSATRKLVPILILIAVVLGGIYGGVFTPTEAGAAGALAALIIVVAKRRLSWGKLWQVLVETGHVSVSILFLIIAANIYARMLALSGLPAGMMEFVGDGSLGLYGTITIYLIIVLFLGMILDSVSIMLITLPLILPAMVAMAVDKIWFGIVTVIAVEIGLLTPPLGLTVFVVKATLGNSKITLNEIFAGTLPFVVIMVLVTILLVAVPELTSVFR